MNLISLIYSRYKAKKVIKKILTIEAPTENKYPTIDEDFLLKAGFIIKGAGRNKTWYIGKIPILKQTIVWTEGLLSQGSKEICKQIYTQAESNGVISNPNSLTKELRSKFFIRTF